ncbi:MAG TPA: LptF/LptG family permease [Planctomycetota bacterium]|nr:LptF/LptG family permease [Planctomycetota bacterium]
MILQRYLLRQVVLSFLFTFAVVLAVFLVGLSFQVFRAYSSIGMGMIVRIIPLATAGAAAWAVLLAISPSVTLVYGRLSADNEIDAMRISGIATRRMVTPALLFGLLVSAGTYGILEFAVPQASYARRVLIREFSVALLQSPPPGKQHFAFGTFALSYLDSAGGVMQMPYLTEYEGMRIKTEYTALTAKAQVEEGGNVRLLMNKWTAMNHDASGRVTLASAENEFTIDLNLNEILKPDKRADNLRTREMIKEWRNEPDPRKRNWMLTSLYSRFGQSLAPFCLVVIAVPIGIMVRRGSRLAGMGAALPPLLLYLVLFFLFRGMGDNGRVPAPVAAFAPDAILLAIGSGLLLRVCRR